MVSLPWSNIQMRCVKSSAFCVKCFRSISISVQALGAFCNANNSQRTPQHSSIKIKDNGTASLNIYQLLAAHMQVTNTSSSTPALINSKSFAFHDSFSSNHSLFPSRVFAIAQLEKKHFHLFRPSSLGFYSYYTKVGRTPATKRRWR